MDEVFLSAWRAMESIGGCDGEGGAQCKRIYAEWIASGKPWFAAVFIVDRANAPCSLAKKRIPQPSEN